MGICASCLGRDRRSSQDIDETDALLGETQHAQYGGIDNGEFAQPDEEELRRERERLEHITAEAADNMIDVSHPTATELSSHFAQAEHRNMNETDDESAKDGEGRAAAEDSEDDAEENAWLQSLQASGIDTQVTGLESGALVMDIGHLRQDPGLTSAKKSLKAALR